MRTPPRRLASLRPRLRPLVLVFMLGTTTAPAVAQTATPVTSSASDVQHFYTANGLLNRGLYDHAIVEYEAFLAAQPEHAQTPMARYGLGVCHYRLGRFERAAEVLAALVAEPEFPYAAEVRIMIGQSLVSLGRAADAVPLLDDLVAHHASHDLADDAAALLVEATYGLGQYPRTIEVAETLAARWPRSDLRTRAEFFRALAEMATARYGDAADRFRQVIARDQDSPLAAQAALLRAQCMHRSGQHPAARTAYREIVRTGGPFTPDAQYGLAVLLHEDGAIDDAASTLDAMLEASPSHERAPDARLLRGRIRLNAKQYAKAATLFASLGDVTGLADDGAYWLARCDLDAGRDEAAATALGLAITAHATSPLVPDMRYDRAVALRHLGRLDEAARELRLLVEQGETHRLAPHATYLLAAIAQDHDNPDGAIAIAEEFLQRYGTHALAPAARLLVAEAHDLAGRTDRAAAAYRAILDADPNAPNAAEVRSRLGLALHRLGRFADARPVLEAAVAEAPSGPNLAHLALGDIAFQEGRWADAATLLRAFLDAEPETSADDALLKLGLACQRQGHSDDALAAYDRLLDAFADSPHRLHAMFERGQTLLRMDRTDDAAAAFDAVLKAAPDSAFAAHAQNHLGTIALRQGDAVRAAQAFERAAGAFSAPTDAADARLRAARALLNAQRYDEAARVLDAVRSANATPSSRRAATALLSIARARQGRHDDAVALADEARSDGAGLEPELLAAVDYERARSLRALARHDEAREAYQHLVAAPQSTVHTYHARLELAELDAELDQLDDAISVLRDVDPDALDPERLNETTYRLGVYEYRKGDFAAAAQTLAALIERAPTSRQADAARALCAESAYRIGAYEPAIAQFTMIVDAGPSHASYETALLRLGECRAALQHWPASADMFRRALKEFPDGPSWYQAQFGIGWAAENQGRYDAALAAYRDVVARHQGPTAARAQFQIGECLFAQKQHDDAVREFLKVDILYAYPEWSAAALYEAGRCFEALGDVASARAQFEAVRRDHASTNWASLAGQRLEVLASSSSLPGR